MVSNKKDDNYLKKKSQEPIMFIKRILVRICTTSYIRLSCKTKLYIDVHLNDQDLRRVMVCHKDHDV